MRTINLTLELTDEEVANLLSRFTSVDVENLEDFEPTAVAQATKVQEVIESSGDAITSEYDSRGIAWNEDFHAATRKVTAAGAWKKRRGADAEKLKAYESAAMAPETKIPAFLQQPVITPDVQEASVNIQAGATSELPLPVPAATIPVMTPPDPPVSMQQITDAYTAMVQLKGQEFANGATQRIYEENNITDPNVLHTNETLRAAVLADFLKVAQ